MELSRVLEASFSNLMVVFKLGRVTRDIGDGSCTSTGVGMAKAETGETVVAGVLAHLSELLDVGLSRGEWETRCLGPRYTRGTYLAL